MCLLQAVVWLSLDVCGWLEQNLGLVLEFYCSHIKASPQSTKLNTTIAKIKKPVG